MTAPSLDYGTVVVALFLVPALVLVALGRGRARHPATLMACWYASWAGFQFVPLALHLEPPRWLVVWYVAADVAMIASLAWFRHRVERETRPAARITRTWLAGNYGAAAAMCLLTATFPAVIPLPTFVQQLFAYRVVFVIYYATMCGLILGALVPGPPTAPGASRRHGVARFAAGVAFVPAGVILIGIAGADTLSPALWAAAGLCFAAPFAGPRLAAFAGRALVLVAGIAAARIAYVTGQAMAALGPGSPLHDPSTGQLVAAGLQAVPGIVWAICARQAWATLARDRAPGLQPRLLAIFETCMAATGLLMVFLWLLPPELQTSFRSWHFAVFLLRDWLVLAAVAVGGHAARLQRIGTESPAPAEVAALYGSAGAIALGSFLMLALPQPPWVVPYLATNQAYIVIGTVLALRHLARVSRGARWWRVSGEFVAGRADALVLAIALLGMGTWAFILVSEPPDWRPTAGKLVAVMLTSWAIAVPIAVRNLGEVVRGLLVTATALLAAAAVYLTVPALTVPLAAAGLDRLVAVVTLAAFVAVLGPGQAWVRAAVDRVVLRRNRRRRAELQAFLQTLSPELGAVACCRRALERLVPLMRCRHAAVILAGGEAVAEGALALEPLRRAWPADAGALPARALVGYELGELPHDLREALRDAGVTGIVPLRSPRRLWGHLVFGLRLLDSPFRDEDTQAIENVAGQLALVLDGTELLGRARDVERSLAHAEKLAALGELAARIAHEIRNPVTAARSLAQQLRRERPAADDDPAGLILAELERVERQVAALLRFARREELRLEPVDLGALVRGTLEAYRARVDTAGVGLELDVADGVVVRADAERLRQVLVNLIENALDALAEESGERRLALAVSAANGSGELRVRDSGAGVSPDRLPHLFEPFFTTKMHGTGLGLAIAKRTIDAHGGRLSAEAAPGGGAVFIVQLPAVRSMEP